MRTCSVCGGNILDGLDFCQACGTMWAPDQRPGGTAPPSGWVPTTTDDAPLPPAPFTPPAFPPAPFTPAPYAPPPHGPPIYGGPPVTPVAYPVSVYGPYGMPKSKGTAAVLCFFLGGFGVHRFYTGQSGLGVALLLQTLILVPLTLGIWGIVVFVWVVVDFIMILSGGVRDHYGQPLR